MNIYISYVLGLLLTFIYPSLTYYNSVQHCCLYDGHHDKSQCQKEECGPGMMCSIRAVQFPDGIKYYDGCINAALCNSNDELIYPNNYGGRQLCGKCCKGDYCNANLCGEEHHEYRPVKCLGMHPYPHKTQDNCGSDEVCATRVVQIGNIYEYYGGCVSQTECDNRYGLLTSPNPYHGTQVCGKCCHGLNCNANLCLSIANTSTIHHEVKTTPVTRGYSCSACYAAYSLNHCPLDYCGSGEKCILRVVEYAQGIQYYGGCVSDNYCNNVNDLAYPNYYGGRQLCGKCCEGPDCNAHLCREDQHEYEPYPCVVYDYAHSLQRWTTYQMCDRYQTCMLRVVEYSSGLRFYGGCVGYYDCKNESLIAQNDHHGRQVCGECCHGHYCNKDLCQTTTATITTASSSTTMTTTTTSATTSTTTFPSSPATSATSSTATTSSIPSTTIPTTTVSSTTTSTVTPVTITTTAASTVRSSVSVTHSMTTDKSLFPCSFCHNVSSIDHCTGTEFCHQTERCSINVVQISGGQIKYFGRCVPDYECMSGMLLSGDTIGNRLCGECCMGDFCNKNLCNQHALMPPLPIPSTGTSTFKTTTIAALTTPYTLTLETTLGIPSTSTSSSSLKPTTLAPTTQKIINTSPSVSYSMTTKNHKFNCLSCNKVSSIDDCKQTEPCEFENKMCSLMVLSQGVHKEVSGSCVPEFACSDSGQLLLGRNLLCGECCKGDTCNRNLCLKYAKPYTELKTTTETKTTTKLTTLPTTTTPTTSMTATTTTTTTTTTTIHKEGFTCLSCNNVSSIADCNKTEECQSTEMCTLSVFSPKEVSGSCLPKFACSNSGKLLLGAYILCGECCEGDSCNQNLCLNYTPMKCNTCSGIGCGVTPGSEQVETCPKSKSYCMNMVQNLMSGQKRITKMCSDETECNNRWWEKAECISFHPLTNYSFPFTCSYCCTSPRCNKELYPAMPHLYTENLLQLN